MVKIIIKIGCRAAREYIKRFKGLNSFELVALGTHLDDCPKCKKILSNQNETLSK